MEPYRRGSNTDAARMVLEIIFLVWLSQMTADFTFATAAMVKRAGPGVLLSIVSLIDGTSLLLFWIYVAMRANILLTVYRNPIIVPTNSYQMILETVASRQGTQTVINFLNIAMALCRFMLFYRFQARLNVLNKILTNAVTDIYHFMVLAITFLGGYAAMAHFLFGSSIEGYSSYGKAVQAVWEMVLGNFDYGAMDYVNPDMACLFFITFIFLIVFVLLNVFLAIIVEAYARAQGDGDTVADELGFGVRRGVHAALGRRKFAEADVVAALQALQARGKLAATEAEIRAEVLRVGVASASSAAQSAVHRPGFAEHAGLARVPDGDDDEEGGGRPEPADTGALVAKISSMMQENLAMRARLAALGVPT